MSTGSMFFVDSVLLRSNSSNSEWLRRPFLNMFSTKMNLSSAILLSMMQTLCGSEQVSSVLILLLRNCSQDGREYLLQELGPFFSSSSQQRGKNSLFSNCSNTTWLPARSSPRLSHSVDLPTPILPEIALFCQRRHGKDLQLDKHAHFFSFGSKLQKYQIGYNSSI